MNGWGGALITILNYASGGGNIVITNIPLLTEAGDPILTESGLEILIE